MTTMDVIVPVRNEIENLPEFRRRICQVRERLVQFGCQLRIVANDNASTDGSSLFLTEWQRDDPGLIVQRFPTLLDFQTSIIRGMRLATGECSSVLQSDLQDPPELLIDMFQEWRHGAKCVVGVPINVHTSIPYHAARKLYYRILTVLIGPSMSSGFQDFYLLDSSIVQALSRYPDRFRFIRAQIATDFGVDCTIKYERMPRQRGKASFNLGSRYGLAMDGLLVHSQRFIRAVTLLGVALSLAAFVAGMAIVGAVIAGVDFAASGWASIVVIVTFAFGVSTFLLSLALEFLFRILTLQTRGSHSPTSGT